MDKAEQILLLRTTWKNMNDLRVIAEKLDKNAWSDVRASCVVGMKTLASAIMIVENQD